MGNSATRNIEYEEAFSHFSELEKSSLEECFQNISLVITDEQRIVDFARFKEHLWLFKEDIAQRYFKEMCAVEKSLPSHDSTKDEVSREAFYISMAHTLHGNHQQSAHIILSLSCVGHNPTVDDVASLYITLVNAYAMAVKKSPYESKWKIENNEESAHKLVGLLCKDLGRNEAGIVTCDDIEKWLFKQPLVEHLFETVFKVCFLGLNAVFGTHSHGQQQGCEPTTSRHSHSNRNILLPCKMKAKWDEMSTILDIPQVLLLNHHLPATCRHRWRLLFSSQIHGESFTRLIHQISHQGPTVLVVRDTDGHMFGGFASQDWTVKSHFTGDNKSFLFSLNPTLSTYHPTGYNENFMYLNTGMETLPNGLGMGGQFEYFGLWLDQEYGKGHSKAQPKCTTYGSPQLSEKPSFDVEILEVWGVGLPPEQEAKKGSVLDTETEAKALLEIAGKKIHSEGLREPETYSDEDND